MRTGVVRTILHVGVLAACGLLIMLVGPRIWPDMREKPVELFVAGLIGGFMGMYLFYALGIYRVLDLIKLPGSRKTDPVIGAAPKDMKTYEEWREDLDKVDGMGGLDEFLAKWSDVPRTKKGESMPVGSPGVAGGPGLACGPGPTGSGLPEDVVKWIDKHYERAAQLWMRAHPGQSLPNPRA